jgi:hypothetical protein
LLRKFYDFPRALDLLAIIVAGMKNLNSILQAGLLGHGLHPWPNLETQKHLLRFPNLPAKRKTVFLRAPDCLPFRNQLSALMNKRTTAANRPVGSI